MTPLSVPVAFTDLAIRDALPNCRRPYRASEQSLDLDGHLNAALEWLCRAQDICTGGGVSYGYSLRGGWLPPYRETTGYILPTMLRAAQQLGRPELITRAIDMANWLVSVQNCDGSVSNPKYGPAGIVFDTGQVLFGLVAAYENTGEGRFLDAAQRAAQWLTVVADGRRLWTRSEHMGNPHVYNTRTAWAALVANRHLGDADVEVVCRANLEWAVENQNNMGFFFNNAFDKNASPYIHNISYAICGLQESGWLLGEETFVQSAKRCGLAVLDFMHADGFIPGAISPDGAPRSWYSCLTGQCQLSIAWARQARTFQALSLDAAASRSLHYVLGHHVIEHREPGVAGGLAGSAPIWGRYAPMSFPNWAAKFLVDALLIARAQKTPTSCRSANCMAEPAG